MHHISNILNFTCQIGCQNSCRVLFFTIFIFCFSCKNENKEVATLPDLDKTEEVTDKNGIRFDSTLYEFEDGFVKLDWKQLLSVRFEKQYNAELELEVDMPVFSDTLLALNGKDVIAEGFYIPVDETGNSEILILSAYPFAQCFFCGAAGAESVIDVLNVSKLPKLKTDQKIKFKGKLKLNSDNFDFLIYVLEMAEYIPT
ncbi:MAG: hypothetical protein IPM42_18015 [Saprospiraceae bacterium]|nr:hypothetical protein [Saprospiraceae bacterium]